MGLCVVDLNGRRISGRMALVRNVLRLIDAWPGLYIVGLIVARMSPLYQRLGDRVAHTLVVAATSVPLARYSRPAMLRRLLLLVSIATLFAAFCLSFSYYERPPLVIESWKNINNTYGFGLAAPLPPCGQVAYVFDNYTLGQSIDFYHLGQPQWKSDMMTYPIEYRLKGGNQTCNSSITLKWYGFLSGGWEVYHIGSQSVDFNAQGNHI
jgi:hypothetical protein